MCESIELPHVNQYLQWSIMNSITTSFNPSDYEYLLKSIAEGSVIAKAQSLKRLNSLVLTDRKTFCQYAKRIVLAIQDLFQESKDEINLLVSTLTLEIINLNPKEIEYYVRTKLLKHVVANLGDSKPQLRKTSHYCLLAYVKIYRNFQDVISAYLDVSIASPEPQLRQKGINSLQSILITESKCLNWHATQFRKLFEGLIARLKDENPYVQKAAEQCLLSVTNMEEVGQFTKRLSLGVLQQFKNFCESQRILGNLIDLKIEVEKESSPQRSSDRTPNTSPEVPIHQKTANTIAVKAGNIEAFSTKMAIIDQIQQIRKNSQNGKSEEETILRKHDSVNLLGQIKEKLNTQMEVPEKEVNPLKRSPSPTRPSPKVQEKAENILNRQLFQDLRNQKDWKARLQAVEDLQTKFDAYHQGFEAQFLMKNLIPTLIKLLADSNFKIALISLKIMSQVIKLPSIELQVVVPPIVEKLCDSKIALRQNVAKLIRSQYLASWDGIWLDNVLEQLRLTSTSNIRQEILNILIRLYTDVQVKYPFERVVEAACPMMDDLKTKIKIRALDLLVLITIKTEKVDAVKAILMNRMNQVYYEMYLEKISKSLKSIRSEEDHSLPTLNKQHVPAHFPSIRKISPNNTTSTSLSKYSKTIEPTNSRSSAELVGIAKTKHMSEVHFRPIEPSIEMPKNHEYALYSTPTDSQKSKELPLKSIRKKLQHTYDLKTFIHPPETNQILRPFADPQKELKNLSNQIKSENWQIAHDALTKLRRIISHHRSLLRPPTIRVLVIQIMRHVESLRSSLSRNGVVTLNDLSLAYKKDLDSDLELIFSKLIRKTLDANSFISEEVKKALVSVCSNCNENKVVTLLTSAHTSRAIPIKTVVVHILENIMFAPKIYEKELQRIVTILISFLNQGSLEIRERTKELLRQIITTEKGGSPILKLIPSDFVNRYKQKEVEEAKKTSSQFLKKKHPQKIVVFPEQFQVLQGLYQKAEGGEWKARLESMNEICTIFRQYPRQASQYRPSHRAIDLLSKQMSDPNSKVSVNALNCFKQIITLVPSLVESNLSVILNELFNCFSSQRSDIRQLSFSLFDCIASSIEKWMLLQHMCNGVIFALPKSRLAILEKIMGILPQCHRLKSGLLARSVCPMINKLAEEGKAEMLIVLRSAVEMCYELMGDEASTYLKQKAKSLVSE